MYAQVTGKNAEEYCNQVVAALLEKGVRAQVDAFVGGIDSVLDCRQLQCLYEVSTLPQPEIAYVQHPADASSLACARNTIP